jgi:hypothetical protein
MAEKSTGVHGRQNPGCSRRWLAEFGKKQRLCRLGPGGRSGNWLSQSLTGWAVFYKRDFMKARGLISYTPNARVVGCLRAAGRLLLGLAAGFAGTGVAAGGQVVGWGTGSPITKLPANLDHVTALSAGPEHAVALKDDGTVVAWGYGNGTNVPAGLNNVSAVVAGYNYSVALLSNGTVTVWGVGPAKTYLPTNLQGVVAVAAGYRHCLALKSDGTVVAWGEDLSGETIVPADLTNAVAIAAGNRFSAAVRQDGTVVVWGARASSVMQPPAGLTNVIALAVGWRGGSDMDSHCLALLRSGTVVAWGDRDWGKCNVPSDLGEVIAVAAGGDHSMALTSDHRVVCWGWNQNGQSTPPAELTAASAIAAASSYSLAILDTLPPVISGHPAGVLANTGETVTFVAAANGTPPLSWQWYFNDAPLPGATGPSLTITNVQLANCGSYHVVVSNPYGTATSLVATLAIRVLDLQMISGLTIEHPPGSTIQLDWSEDLQTWHPLTNFVLPFSPYRFADWSSAGQPRRYYRVR